MKKYLIIRFLGSLSLILSPALALAASTDFVANGNITVSSVAGSGVTADLVILSGSQAETVVTGSEFTVTNPDSTNPFQVKSSDSLVISIKAVDGNGTQAACISNSTPGTSYLELPIAAGTYTITPTTSACSGAAVSGGSANSDGTPSSSISSTATSTSTVSTSTESAAEPSPSPAVPTLPAQASPVATIALTRGLKLGIVGTDVQNLQRFLNANGFVVALSGAGSVGNETTYFGRATQAALLKFQIAKSIVKSQDEPGAGTVGPKTRALINSMGIGTSASPASISQTIDPQSLQMLFNLLRQLQTKSNSN